MNMEELYSEMKASLKFFNLAFSDMDQVEISINKENEIVFTHDGRKTAIKLPG